MIYFLKSFPGKQQLLKKQAGLSPDFFRYSNLSVASPYSFTPFRDFNAMAQQAVHEGVELLGISDRLTTDGFDRFADTLTGKGVFPLFGLRVDGYSEALGQKRIRINDPDIAGRLILHGKAMDYPFIPDSRVTEKLKALREEDQLRIAEMIEHANRYMRGSGLDIRISYEEIRTVLSKKMVTDRHIARAIRIELYKDSDDEKGRMALLRKLFAGKEVVSRPGDEAGLEYEIRSRLLRPGGGAYVEENNQLLPGPSEMVSLIKEGGGIPCYPLLRDDTNGRYTELESHPELLIEKLKEWKIGCVEITPARNEIRNMTDMVTFLREAGFLVVAGTGHFTPRLSPLKVQARLGNVIPDKLHKVFWEGACVLAAHQYLKARGFEGYPVSGGLLPAEKRKELEKIGKAVTEYYFALGNQERSVGFPAT